MGQVTAGVNSALKNRIRVMGFKKSWALDHVTGHCIAGYGIAGYIYILRYGVTSCSEQMATFEDTF